MIHQKKI